MNIKREKDNAKGNSDNPSSFIGQGYPLISDDFLLNLDEYQSTAAPPPKFVFQSNEFAFVAD